MTQQNNYTVFFKIITTFLALILTLAIFSPTAANAMAAKVNVDNIPEQGTLTADNFAEYVGEVSYPRFSYQNIGNGLNQYQSRNIYFVELNTKKVIAFSYQSPDDQGNISFKQSLYNYSFPVGQNYVQAFATKDGGVTPQTLDDVLAKDIESKSPVLNVYQKKMELSLFASDYGVPTSIAQNSSVSLQPIANQYLQDDSKAEYFFDATNDKFVRKNSSGQVNNGASANFDYGPPRRYQAIIADDISNPNPTPESDFSQDYLKDLKISQLTGVIAESNAVTVALRPWTNLEVVINDTAPWLPDASWYAYAKGNGGGNYAVYLVDKRTQQVVYNSIDQVYMKGEHRSTKPAKENLIAYAARNYSLDKTPAPVLSSDLQDIVATSDGWYKSYTGLTDPASLNGGTNPSTNCPQSCAGDPINTFTGEFYLNNTDKPFNSSGLSPIIQRNYGVSNRNILTSMGYGWRSNYDMKLESTDPLQTGALSDAQKIRLTQENGSILNFIKQDGVYLLTGTGNIELKYDAILQSFVLIRNKTDKFIFNSVGQLTKLSDRNNNIVDITYNPDRTISTVADAQGNTLTYNYANNLLKNITDQTGRSTEFTYDISKKLLLKVKNYKDQSFTYTYDGSRRMATLSNALGGVTTNIYNNANQVTQQTDPLGNVSRLSYNYYSTDITAPNGTVTTENYASGQLTQRIERLLDADPNDNIPPVTRRWIYSYGANNAMTNIINPDNTNVSSKLDSRGNAIESRDANGNVSKATYNDLNQPLTLTNALGQTTTNTYDAQGNLLTSVDPLGNKTSFSYDSSGRLTGSTDARGNATGANPADYTNILQYNSTGLVSSATDSAGSKTLLGYDAKQRLTTTTDPKGNSNTIEYNALNLPSKVKDALANETALTYDAAGNVLTSQDALGNVTTNTYDLNSNLLTTKNALNQTTSYSYDAMGNVIKITDPANKVSEITYDGFGRVTNVKNPLGKTVQQTWNAMDQLISNSDALGNKTTFSYDSVGNLLQKSDPLGNKTNYLYNAVNAVVNFKDASNRITQFEYDAAGQLTKTIKPDQTAVTQSYDPLGNVLTKTNESGKTSSWEYNNLGQKIKYTNETGDSTSYSYDVNGNLLTQSRPDGSQVKYEYDARNLLTKLDYPGTDSDIVYLYDALGRKISETVANQTPTAYSYDALGQMTSRGPPNSKVSYEFDSRGNNTKLMYPSGRVVNYSYDDANQLTSLDSSGIGTIGYSYSDNGSLTNTTLPNGVNEVNTYDASNSLTKTELTKNAASLYSKSQSYSPTYDIKQRSVSGDTPKLEDFTYDPTSKLTQQTKNSDNTPVNTFAYDATGNLTKVNDKVQSFDDAGKLVKTGSNSLVYDNRGNRTNLTNSSDTTQSKSYEWDQSNLLAQVTTSAGTVDYSYDASGLLSSRNTSGTTQGFTWDVSKSIPVMLADGEYEYVYGAGRVPIAQVKLSDGVITFLTTDLVGSVTATTDSSGALTGSTDYSPYGENLGARLSNFGYAGEWSDPATGYSYLRARWYDPSTGSFLSLDPLVQSTSAAYSYTGGNPLTRVDPLGLCNVMAGDLGNPASDCYGFADSAGFKSFSNWIAGFGDSASFGGTNALRDLMGTNNVVNKCDGFYTFGGYSGDAALAVTPSGLIKKISLGTLERVSVINRLPAISKNPVSTAFENIGAGNMTAKQAKEQFTKSEFEDYITNPGFFAESSGSMKVPSYLKPGTTGMHKKDKELFNSMGDKYGCHHCGVKTPGSSTGNWVEDHMPPTALADGLPQKFYPQCLNCMNQQGAAVRSLKGQK